MSSTQVIIYSKQGCAQCIQAETLCKLRGLDFQIKKLDKDYKLEDLQVLTGKRSMSMPVIEWEGKGVLTFAEFTATLKK